MSSENNYFEGQEASEASAFRSTTTAVSGVKKMNMNAPATTNQNAFYEEYKQNLRKINSKKASSPNMKSSFASSRLSAHGSHLP